MIKLKDILKEDEVTDKFGNVAFGENPNIAALQNKPIEKDTEFELEIKNALKKWIDNSQNLHADTLYSHIEILKKAKKRFPSILSPDTPDGTELYRGLRKIDQNFLSKLKKTKKEDWKAVVTDSFSVPYYKYTKPINYTPHRKIQSWTTDRYIAQSFADKSAFLTFNPLSNANLEPCFVLSTVQNSEFFFNQKMIDILGMPRKSENEILHLGTIFKENVYVSVDSLNILFV